MKKRIVKNKNILRNINLFITFLVAVTNIAVFLISDANKANFIVICCFINVYLFFLHWFLLAKQLKKNVNEIKKEALYINYPANITTFFLCLVLVLIASSITLFIVNKEAFVPAFVFTFFMSIISMLFPSIMLLVYIYFIVPAFIVPSFSSNRQNRSDSTPILLAFLVLFSAFTAYKMISYTVRAANIDKQNKYKIIKLPIQYSTKYLKLDEEISSYGKKRLAQSKVEVPFVYTSESFSYKDYDSAEIFCKSMGARVPNYLEMYNIVFNRFDTFGERYYWTSDKDGRTPLVIHFNNMSYNVERYNKKVKPILYCVSSTKARRAKRSNNYFYRDIKKESADTIKGMMKKTLDTDALLDIVGKDYQQKFEVDKIETEIQFKDTSAEKKHVFFSVREVSADVLDELTKKGYEYDSQVKISSRYETNDLTFDTQINRDLNRKEIKLCYYPFMDYGSLNMYNESQIWKQSFCSPAFELISPTPVLKSQYEKDSYCASMGGKVPNIPELNGILKSLSMKSLGTKFWTSHKVKNNTTNFEMPVAVYYKDSRFMTTETIPSSSSETAYTFCIKKSARPSKIVANYKSRFKGMKGASYANMVCPTCQYYEVPDTILLSY